MASVHKASGLQYLKLRENTVERSDYYVERSDYFLERSDRKMERSDLERSEKLKRREIVLESIFFLYGFPLNATSKCHKVLNKYNSIPYINFLSVSSK